MVRITAIFLISSMGQCLSSLKQQGKYEESSSNEGHRRVPDRTDRQVRSTIPANGHVSHKAETTRTQSNAPLEDSRPNLESSISTERSRGGLKAITADIPSGVSGENNIFIASNNTNEPSGHVSQTPPDPRLQAQQSSRTPQPLSEAAYPETTPKSSDQPRPTLEDLRKEIYHRLEDHKYPKTTEPEVEESEDEEENEGDNSVRNSAKMHEAILLAEVDRQIIFPEDVLKVWAPIYYRQFYTRRSWYDPLWDKNDFMDSYLKIMSILVQIHFTGWEEFRRIFIEPGNRQDRDLPLPLDVLKRPDCLDVFGKNFYDAQLAFCPIPIREMEQPIEMNGLGSLPWLDKPRKVARGAFGRVTKQTVAKGYLQYENKAVNPTVSDYSVKKIHQGLMPYTSLSLLQSSVSSIKKCKRLNSRISKN